jgi:hypothetical protein
MQDGFFFLILQMNKSLEMVNDRNFRILESSAAQ